MRVMIFDERSRTEFIRLVQQVELKRKYVGIMQVYRRQRSIKQNRLYHLWLKCVSEHTGHTEEELDLFFKEMFLSWNSKQVLGREVVLPIHTSNLNTKEFTDYLEKIRMFALNDLSVYLPEPGESSWENFYTHYGIDA
jgi:NinB protein